MVLDRKLERRQEGEGDDGLSYQQEMEQALENDPQRIGQVWRNMAELGRHPETIRAALGLATVGTVHNSMGSIDTLLKRSCLTSAPTLALQRARMLRNFAKRHNDQISEQTKTWLQDLAHEHQRVAENEDALADEADKIEQTDRLGSGTPGIYVYTLPHYLRFPVSGADSEESNPRTYLKVGMSSVDAQGRIQQQVTTALPEPPLVLRRYGLKERDSTAYEEIEKKMRRHLNAADHNQNRRRGAGKEWFLTHLTFIDSTAELLGLVIEYEDENHPSTLEHR